MEFLILLFFVFVCSIDNLVVAIAYGFKNIKINLSANLIIATISTLGTFVSMKFGRILLEILPNNISYILGDLFLIIIGISFIFSWIKNNNLCNKGSCEFLLHCPENADKDKSGVIDLKESFMLSLALTFNNFALGIGGSLSGFNIILTSIILFIFSVLLIPLGIFLGSKLSKNNLASKSSLISGCFLIILGILQILWK